MDHCIAIALKEGMVTMVRNIVKRLMHYELDLRWVWVLG